MEVLKRYEASEKNEKLKEGTFIWQLRANNHVI